MTGKFPFYGALLLASLLAGCATKPEPIPFLSASQIPAYVEKPAAIFKGLSRDDEQQIDQLVFSDLLKRPGWNDGDYAAIIVEADDAIVNALHERFPDHNPPLQPVSRLDLHPGGPPLDRENGLPVLILSVKVKDPGANGSVTAVGRWYAGPAVNGDKTFILGKAGDDWTIAGFK